MAESLKDEALQCALPSWYTKFEDVTFKTLFIPLSQDFVDYLQSDGIVLPEGCELPSHVTSSVDDDEENKEEWKDDENDIESELQTPVFSDLVQRISDCIRTLNGAAFPKLNWSSPMDAAWVSSDNTLKCTVPAEVILLLKSSDCISHDLTKLSCYIAAGRPTLSYTLCLRQWTDVQISGEFRCFIKDCCIIGVSQRDCSTSYKHLLDNVELIMTDITCFYKTHIVNRFPLRNYIMDVYRPRQGHVTLVDFGTFSPTTKSFLFKWEELDQMSTGEGIVPELRLIEDPMGIQPSQLHMSRLPKDIVDLADGGDMHTLIDLMNIQRLQQDDND